MGTSMIKPGASTVRVWPLPSIRCRVETYSMWARGDPERVPQGSWEGKKCVTIVYILLTALCEASCSCAWPLPSRVPRPSLPLVQYAKYRGGSLACPMQWCEADKIDTQSDDAYEGSDVSTARCLINVWFVKTKRSGSASVSPRVSALMSAWCYMTSSHVIRSLGPSICILHTRNNQVLGVMKACE